MIVGSFLDSGGDFTEFRVPGSLSTAALGINDAGQIVGSTDSQGFLYSGGNFIQIDVPGATSTEATGINNAREIGGYFDDSTGAHGFVATAIPEPATLPLLGIGFITLIGLGIMRRRVTSPCCQKPSARAVVRH